MALSSFLIKKMMIDRLFHQNSSNVMCHTRGDGDYDMQLNFYINYSHGFKKWGVFIILKKSK